MAAAAATACGSRSDLYRSVASAGAGASGCRRSILAAVFLVGHMSTPVRVALGD
jgi:hypothetical protein